MVSLDFFKKIKVFNGLDNNQLRKIQEGCLEKEYKKNERLFGEGEEAKDIWIVLDGQVDIRFDLPGRVTTEESTVYSETATKTFGWSSFVSPYKYILSAYCASKSCNVARIDKEYLIRLFESDYNMGFIVMNNLAGVMSSRFHDMQKSPLTTSYSVVKITVHMATCGIAAGAREVMSALQKEILRTQRYDIVVESSGCIGKCSTEPNVTVEIGGEDPVIYKHMSAENIRRVFQEHILNGRIPADLVLS